MDPLEKDELQEGISVANEDAQRSQTSQFKPSFMTLIIKLKR